MKKLFSLLLALCLLALSFSGCSDKADSIETGGSSEGEDLQMTAIFRGTVFDISEPLGVEMEETEYSFGPYHVITSDETEYYDKNGSPTSREAIKVGDAIEITFSGQVMMSYPPKISAQRIKILS